MSKSRGNVIYADDLAKVFGVDAVRYYLLAEMPFAQDGSITYEQIITRCNADLANTLGNLVNRSIAMAGKYFGGTVRRPAQLSAQAESMADAARQTLADYTRLMDGYRNADAVEAIMSFAKRCNKYIDETTPWILAKDPADRGRLEEVLYVLLEGIRVLGILLQPITPGTSAEIFRQLQADGEATAFEAAYLGAQAQYTVTAPVPLFARLDPEQVTAQIQALHPADPAEPEKPAQAPFLPEFGIDEFMKGDVRVARVTACEPVKKSKKLLKLTLDDGSGTPRTVCSGIAAWYKPEDLTGHSVLLVANLKPAVLCGVESNGMILAADANGEARVIFADGLPIGARVR